MNKSIDTTDVLPGFLLKIKSKTGFFYHLTWKEKKKTITRYIRLDEVKRVKDGIKAYKKAKTVLNEKAFENLKTLILQRKSK